METIKLRRTKNRPTAFLGEEIFTAETDEKDARKKKVRIFENYTEGGYVVGIAQITYMVNEKDGYEVTKFEKGDQIRPFLEKEIPDLKLEDLPDLTKEVSPMGNENGEWRPKTK